MPTLISIQVGRPHLHPAPDWAKRPRWRSAYVKEAVPGPVRLGFTNLEGDRQADLRVHGGPDMAVLCYSADHYPAWREELGLAGLGPGAFGENFTLQGQSEWDVCVGDVYRVGGAEAGSVLVQVSQPRGPCYKIGYRWGRPDLLRRVEETGRHGWYLRVLEPGLVAAGADVRLEARPHPRWTIRRAADAYRARGRDRRTALELGSCEALSRAVRARLMEAAGLTLEG